MNKRIIDKSIYENDITNPHWCGYYVLFYEDGSVEVGEERGREGGILVSSKDINMNFVHNFQHIMENSHYSKPSSNFIINVVTECIKRIENKGE